MPLEPFAAQYDGQCGKDQELDVLVPHILNRKNKNQRVNIYGSVGTSTTQIVLALDCYW